MTSGDEIGAGPWLDDLQAQLESMLLDGTRGLAAQLAEFARYRVAAALREDLAHRGASGAAPPAAPEAVGYGSVLEAVEAASIFAAPDRLSPVGRLVKGDLVEAAGPRQELEGGRIVLPIVKPAGVVHFDSFAHRPELRASYAVKAHRLDIFESPTSWDPLPAASELMQGDRVAASGPPVDVQGSVMLPIAPQGAVELCHLEVAEYVECERSRAPRTMKPADHLPPAAADDYGKFSPIPPHAEPSEVLSVPVSEDAALDVETQAELEDLRRDAEILEKQVERTGGSVQARRLAESAAERYRDALARARSRRSAAQLYRGVPHAQTRSPLPTQADRTPPGAFAPITGLLPERADVSIISSGMSSEALQSRRALLTKNEELGRRLEGISDGLQRSMRNGP